MEKTISFSTSIEIDFFSRKFCEKQMGIAVFQFLVEKLIGQNNSTSHFAENGSSNSIPSFINYAQSTKVLGEKSSDVSMNSQFQFMLILPTQKSA